MNKKENKITQTSVHLIAKKCEKIAKKDFAKFSVIVGVIFSVVIWVIKSVWYAYMSGKFSLYKIDRCYIDTNSENVFLHIIQLIAIGVIWVFINYLFYKILIAEYKSFVKKCSKVLSFWMVEMILVFVALLLYSDAELVELLREINGITVLVILLLLSFYCVMINVFAIEFYMEKKHREKQKAKPISGDNEKCENDTDETEKKSKEDGHTRIKNMLLTLVITIAVELIFVFFASYYIETHRCGFKSLVVESEIIGDSKFVLECGAEEKRYEIYPIVYENKECYIITRLYKDNGVIKIDYNYQKIIDKEGQETIYIENVKNLNTN